MHYQKIYQKISYKQKPWITAGLGNSIYQKNNICKQLSKSQDITKKHCFAKKIQTLQKSLW